MSQQIRRTTNRIEESLAVVHCMEGYPHYNAMQLARVTEHRDTVLFVYLFKAGETTPSGQIYVRVYRPEDVI